MSVRRGYSRRGLWPGSRHWVTWDAAPRRSRSWWLGRQLLILVLGAAELAVAAWKEPTVRHPVRLSFEGSFWFLDWRKEVINDDLHRQVGRAPHARD